MGIGNICGHACMCMCVCVRAPGPVRIRELSPVTPPGPSWMPPTFSLL